MLGRGAGLVGGVLVLAAAGVGGGVVDGADEEGGHLRSGYRLVGAVVEGLGAATSGYPGVVHSFYSSHHGRVCAFYVAE